MAIQHRRPLIAVSMFVAFVAQPVLAETYTQAQFSGGIYPGNANVKAPFTADFTQGQPLGGSFVFENDLVPGPGTGWVNVPTSSFSDIADIPMGTLFTFNFGPLALTPATAESGFFAVQYHNGLFNGFAGNLDFQYGGLDYQLSMNGTVFAVYKLNTGVPDYSLTYISGYLNTGLTNPTPYTPSVPPPVPEAATWAMMVGGFGLIGRALRRRVRIAYA
jgi:hypothetical protein